MPRLSVHPDDLTAAGARLSDDAAVLTAAAAAVRSAGAEAEAALGPEGTAVRAALGDYVGDDAGFAAALGEAVSLLGRAIVGASAAYADAEQSVASAFSGRSGP